MRLHENVSSQHDAILDEPIDYANESAVSSNRSGEPPKSLDISLEEIADTDLREQIRQLQHRMGCSTIMARAFSNVKCLQSMEDFFKQESEAAAYRSQFDSTPTVLMDRPLVAKTIQLRNLFPTADKQQCRKALIRSQGMLRDARDLLASWEESILKRVAQSITEGDDMEAGSSTESEHDDSQISLPDSDFKSPQKSAAAEDLQVGDDSMSNRKEAYKAALGRGGREWSTYSPITSSTTGGTEDIELR